MSLFRREYLCVGLEPARATVLRLVGARKPQVLAEIELPLAIDPTVPQLGPLIEVLASDAFKAREIHITLADTLVRYFVVECPDSLRNRAELKGAIDARFEEQFGSDAAAWEIAADLAPGASTYLACAVPRPFTEALRLSCADLRLKLLSLTPFTTSEMNRWHRQLPGKDFWFATAYHGSLMLGYRGKRGWSGIRHHALHSQSDEEIGLLAERDGLLHGVSDSVQIRCSGLVSQPVAAAQGASVQRVGASLWPGANENWSARYRLALSGVWP